MEIFFIVVAPLIAIYLMISGAWKKNVSMLSVFFLVVNGFIFAIIWRLFLDDAGKAAFALLFILGSNSAVFWILSGNFALNKDISEGIANGRTICEEDFRKDVSMGYIKFHLVAMKVIIFLYPILLLLLFFFSRRYFPEG